jgi:hypothetical protein
MAVKEKYMKNKEIYETPKLEEYGKYVALTGFSGAPPPGDLDFAPDFLNGIEE